MAKLPENAKRALRLNSDPFDSRELSAEINHLLFPPSLAIFFVVALFLLATTAACQTSDEADTPTPLPPPPIASYPESEVENSASPLPQTGYPVEVSSTPAAYPVSPVVITPELSETANPSRPMTITPGDIGLYIPLIIAPEEPTPTPTPTPTQVPPTPTPTIDFAAVRADLQAQGQDLGFAKIGFHTGVGGNRTGLGEWMRRLDEAGVPFFLKSVDDTGPLVEAQEIIRNSDVPHVLVFRRSGNEYDTPDYNLSPQEAALRHWQLHMDGFPAELDPSLIWLETMNEVDKGRSEWLGQFALETAQLAMANGFRWAAFGWSSGEPEISDWQTPSMLAFLRLAGENPDRLAVALHEYSFLTDNIADSYPFKVGRFQQLFQVADQFGIPRPTVLITEWGWEHETVPSGGKAIEDIHWASALYAPYPELKGAAIWYLGGGFGEIANEAQKLIKPVTEYSLGTYFPIPLPPDEAPIIPEQYSP